MKRSIRSSSDSASGFEPPMPALFTRMSIRPKAVERGLSEPLAGAALA